MFRKPFKIKGLGRWNGIRVLAGILCLFFLFGVFSPAALLAADKVVKIKILAVNPSDSNLDTVVSHRLPPEIQPEHVVDKAGMELRYDPNLFVYYLTSPVVLKPRETRAIHVKVKNVWFIEPEYIERVKVSLTQTVAALEGTRYYEVAQRLVEKAEEQIGRIEEEANKEVNINQQIELFRSHLKQLKQIEEGILSLSKLRQLADAQGSDVRTAKFVIKAQNPSDEQRTMTVRASLPKEISSFDVINRLDFKLLFDEDKKRFVIEKDDIFAPNEEKKYEIIVRDVWYITQDEIEFLRDQAAKLLERFGGSTYEPFAQQTVAFINDLLDKVWALQSEVQDSEEIEDRIRAFTVNNQRLELVKKKIKELQDLLLEIPQRPLTEVDQIKKALQELSKVFDIISLGFTPDLSTTWWIILGIIAFLFVFSASFYTTWLVQLGKTTFGKGVDKKKKKQEQQEREAREKELAEMAAAEARGEGKKKEEEESS